jgi:hypothetical protein
MKRTSIALACCAALSLALNSHANLLVNGSFESYGGPGNSNIGQGLTDWTISGGVDIVFSTGVEPYYWQAADGDVSLSLSYFGPSSVSQSLITTAGQTYQITFSMAAEIYGGPATRTMDVLWNNTTVGSPSFQYTGQGPTSMGWVEFNLNVVGTGNDTLTFLATSAGPYGPALDKVSIVAVPEPTTAGLLAIGLLAFGTCRRRANLAS